MMTLDLARLARLSGSVLDPEPVEWRAPGGYIAICMGYGPDRTRGGADLSRVLMLEPGHEVWTDDLVRMAAAGWEPA